MPALMPPLNRATRRRDEKLLQSYASEATRLREYAANTTTARLRARLLEGRQTRSGLPER